MHGKGREKGAGQVGEAGGLGVERWREKGAGEVGVEGGGWRGGSRVKGLKCNQ